MIFYLLLAFSAYAIEEPLSVAGFTTEYYSQALDHINGDSGLINIKVLLKKGNAGAPLFVYLGGQTNIEFFFNMNGWVAATLGPAYGATVAYIEHRYYGDSLPQISSWAYLNTDQALLDFASIVMQLKSSEDTPVIVFGGSYCGMLAVFFRIKFPYLVDGVISSSSPLLQYRDFQGLGVLHSTTQAYFNISPNCAFNINDAFNILSNFAQNEYTYPGLSEIFSTCSPITEQGQVVAIQDWITNALINLAQVNYPFETNFEGALPPLPVEVVCSVISVHNSGVRNMWNTLQGMAQAAMIFYNNSGTENCVTPWAVDNSQDTVAWEYQTCSELLMPQGSYNLPNDMFQANPFSFQSFSAACMQSFGVSPNPRWYEINYGFTNDYVYSLRNLTNVIFTYGQNDPLMSGSVMIPPNNNVVVMEILGAAHHADLIRPNPSDPQSVINTRSVELNYINQWIANS